MSDLSKVIDRFLGQNPVLGREALEELVALGDRGEEALLSSPMRWRSAQVFRRWLHYVASRGQSMERRLLDRLCSEKKSEDACQAAWLSAGLTDSTSFRRALHPFLSSGVSYLDSSPWMARFSAWGFAGGESWTLLRLVEACEYTWEKLLSFAVEGVCASLARVGNGDPRPLEHLLTHVYTGGKAKELSSDPSQLLGNYVANAHAEANSIFLVWRRGEVADRLLEDSATHPHWRVRIAAAHILASFGLARTAHPILEWFLREPVQSVREMLLYALERSRSPEAADQILRVFREFQGGNSFMARSAWRCTHPEEAQSALESLVATKAPNGKPNKGSAEALVSLAKLGVDSPFLTQFLSSTDSYMRACAAVAIGLKQECNMAPRLSELSRETASPEERLMFAASLTMLGHPSAASNLLTRLESCDRYTDIGGLDLFYCKSFIQEAVLKGLEAGGTETHQSLQAWRAELEPFEPIASPIHPSSPSHPSVTRPPTTEPMPVMTSKKSRPLNVFVSYSHKDERMRRKLDEHLQTLVDEDHVRIWHDRKIDAGEQWNEEIDREIEEANLILLLVSASFLKSPYCRQELLRALQKRRLGSVGVVPIILRPCEWEGIFNSKELKLQWLPRDDRPIAGGRWHNQDVAFAEVIKELRKTIAKLKQ